MAEMRNILPTNLDTGEASRLGAHWDGHGINFAVYSKHAERIELCLFDPSGQNEVGRLALPGRSADTWHGYLPGAGPGLLYGYRVHGPYDPERGHRFNPYKLLLDPYSRALSGRFVWHDAVHGYSARDGAEVATAPMDTRDSAAHVPRSRVCKSPAPETRPARPRIPWSDTVLYELHVRGFSKLHPDVSPSLRGTVSALADATVIGHFRNLGITTIELLPVAAFLDELHLVRRGLRNYWGYNPIAPMAVHAPYLQGGDAAEFARVVDRLHEAGLEVVLDIVLNHTAEGDERGPTLSLRGFDNASYYRLDRERPGYYLDVTGCGNTLDASQPAVLDMMLATLRFWAYEIGVDGFRFDLAPALMRDREAAFDAHAPLLQAIANDPELSALKWIAEPWDLGMPGYFLGHFPGPFAEWNDRYRDGLRRFWRGDGAMIGELATRLSGSSDVFASSGRGPSASINFVTAHDGFTLADLTSYAEKHNRANGEENRDGTSSNWSSNGGVEGETAEAGVLSWRVRVRKSLLGSLLLSRGTPMLRAGDELSQTKRGNNNSYCQDNVISWLDWSARGDAWRDLHEFVGRVLELRRRLPLLRRDRFFDGKATSRGRDILWLRPDAGELDDDDWNNAAACSLALLMTDTEAAGDRPRERLYLACHAGREPQGFLLPRVPDVQAWLCVLDSNDPLHARPQTLYAPGSDIRLQAGGMMALVAADSDALGVPPELARRARKAGVLADYFGSDGRHLQPPAAGLRGILDALEGTSPASVPADAAVDADATSRCWLPPGLETPPGRWALSIQLYGLRSAQSWGIGDFADLARLLELAAEAGADGVLCSPVHAPALMCPRRASPYSPSNRLMLNPLFISVPLAAGSEPPPAFRRFMDHPDVRRTLARLEVAHRVDYPIVSALKLRALACLHRAFHARHLGADPTGKGERFLRFRREGGRVLRDHAVFEALDAWFSQRQGHHVPWTEWPEDLRDPDSPAVARFEREHADQVEFSVYLQWLARDQWQRAAEQARTAGMQLGLIADLALGAGPDSAEAWQWKQLAVTDIELGAPPDAFAPNGQSWGLSPWNPHRLAQEDYLPFDMLLDSVMRDAGAIRIDHIVGLMREFWIPRGLGPDHGSYVRCDFDVLLERVVRASRKHRCAVIGEDLGNVPPSLRERMAETRILGFRVAWFERDDGGTYHAPEAYAPWTAATVSTHDLPTAHGFYQAADIGERVARGLYRLPQQADAARRDRSRALQALREALEPYGDSDDADAFTRSLHRFLAASGSRLVMVQLEDVLGMRRQANLPDLGDVAPNWRLRLPITLEALADDPRMQALAELLAARSARKPS